MITKSATTFITTSATSPALHFSKDLMEKLAILSDAAKYDVACTSSGVNRKGDGNGMGNSLACVFPLMVVVYPCLRYYIPMNAFLTALIARITANLISQEQLLLLRRSVPLLWSFIGEIISKDFF